MTQFVLLHNTRLIPTTLTKKIFISSDFLSWLGRDFLCNPDFKASFLIKGSIENLLKALNFIYPYTHAHMPTNKFCMQFKGIYQLHYNECTIRYFPRSSPILMCCRWQTCHIITPLCIYVSLYSLMYFWNY